jgi:hypothetical protein
MKYRHASAKCEVLAEQLLSLSLTVVGASMCVQEIIFFNGQWCFLSTRYIISKQYESCV